MSWTVTWPNAEVALRDWLRTVTPLTDLLMSYGGGSAQVDLEPDDALPCVVVYRAGGGPDPYVPMDKAVFGFDAWGPGSSRARGASMALRDVLLSALGGMATTRLSSHVVGLGAQVQSHLWLPDPGGRARNVITAAVQLRPSALAA